jgi:hypothetical protein
VKAELAAAAVVLCACHGSSNTPSPDGGGSTSCALTSLVPVCSPDHLCWAAPSPSPLGTIAAAGADGCDYWLVPTVEPGVLPPPQLLHLHGNALDPIALPAMSQLPSAVDVISATDIWVVTRAGGLSGLGGPKHRDPSAAAHFDGTSWTSYATGEADARAVWGSSSSDVWMARDADADTGTPVALFHWNGTTLDQVAGTMACQAGVGLSPTDVWCCSADTANHFDGTTWSGYPLDGLQCDAMWANPDASIYAVGLQGVARWDGQAWVRMYTSKSEELRSVWGTAADDLWVGGDTGQFLAGVVHHFDGTTWSTFDAGPGAVLAIHGQGRDDVLFGGEFSFIAHWDGSTFSKLAGQLDRSIGWSKFFAIDGAVWIGADNPGFPSTTFRDDGSGWHPDQGWPIAGTSPTDLWYGNDHYDGSTLTHMNIPIQTRAMYAVSPADVWAVGQHESPWVGAVAHFDGTTWTELTPPSTVDHYFYAVWADATQVWVLGGGNVYRRLGGQWETIDTKGMFVGDKIFGRAFNDIYFAGTVPGVVHWDGTSFTLVSSDPVNSIGGDATRVWVTGPKGYVAIDEGTGFKRLDSGTSNDLYGAYFVAPTGTSSLTDGWVAGELTLLELRP